MPEKQHSLPLHSESGISSDSGSHDRSRKRKKEEKKHKKHKKHKSSSAAKDLLKEAKRFLKGKLQAGQPESKVGEQPAASRLPFASSSLREGTAAQPPEGTITADDYFQKNPEFTSYLLEVKGLYFNELSSEETHRLFEEFVEVWNAGRLPPKYYGGQVSAPVKRTTYQWGFAGAGDRAQKGATGMAAYMKDEQQQHKEAMKSSREAEFAEKKKWNKEQRVLLDELLPATGTGAGQKLLRKEAAQKGMRKEAKAREESPDRTFLPGGRGDIMGGDDSFEAARAREAKRQEWRKKNALAKEEEVAKRRAEYDASEAAKMAQFRALVAKGPILIPKRQDPP